MRLAQVVQREVILLRQTDNRLFVEPFTEEKARKLQSDPILSEQVDAFVGRFSPLQDTVADLPTFNPREREQAPLSIILIV